jgi:hypothetical protein
VNNLPTEWVGVAALAVIQLGNWLTAHRVHGKIRSVNDQVTNAHGTNMRDDLDEIHRNVICIGAKVDALDNRLQAVERRP